MSRVKAVHLTSVHSTFDARIFTKQCRTLAAAGYDTVLIVQHSREEWVDGVRIRPLPPARSRGQRMLGTALAAVRAAAAERARIYHLHDPELLPWAWMLRLAGGRVVFDLHENVPKQILTKYWIPPWLRAPLSGLARLALRVLLAGVPVVYAETSYARDFPWIRRSVTVLNMPLADRLLAMSEPKEPVFTAGYLGYVEPERGALLMFDALGRLARTGRAAAFECIGPIRDGAAEVERRIAAADYPVRMRGYMALEAAWQHIARCHVGLAVYTGAPNHRESYPTKLFEYMALGLPVVTSDFPLYREMVEANGCGLCVPGTPEAVAAALTWLMDHPDEARAMGERGRDAVRRHFSWNHEAEKLLRFYDDLLAPAGQNGVLRRAGP